MTDPFTHSLHRISEQQLALARRVEELEKWKAAMSEGSIMWYPPLDASVE